MNTHEGYSKKKLDNDNVLLAGGGEKSLADFLGGIRISSSKIQYKAADSAAAWTDLITLVNTDENVKQTPKTDNVNRPLMMINGGTSTGTLTSTSMFSTGIYANASTKMITANGFVKAGSDDTYVLLGGGGASKISTLSVSTAAKVTVTNSDDNSTYRLVWHSSNNLYSTGGIYCNPGTDCIYASHYYETSDRAKKTNIEYFSEHIRKFTLKASGKTAYGVIAQEVAEMFREGEDGNMTVNYSSVLSYYIGALENRIKVLEDEINKLKNK